MKQSRNDGFQLFFFANGEEIICTAGHPFYVVGVGFFAAKDLKLSDKLLLSDGKSVIIEEIKVEQLEDSETTYNFEVEDFHTYYVSESNVLVHNTCPRTEIFDTKTEAEEYFKKELGANSKVIGKSSVGSDLYKSADGLKIGYLDTSHHPFYKLKMNQTPDHFNIQVRNESGRVIKDIHIFWGIKK